LDRSCSRDATNSAKVPDIEEVCPFFLEEGGKKRPHARMTKVRGKCLGVDIEINPDREIVLCDGLTFPWDWKEEDGYFLVKMEDGMICIGYVDGKHQLNIEFRGTDPETLTKEIVRRDFLNPSHIAYIAAEIILAHHCLQNGTEYIQR
jgi:hypothetical protein